MKKEPKKSVDTTAKKKDIVENNNTDIVNETKPDAVVEAKPDAAPKSKSLIIKLEDLVPFKDHPYLVREGVELDDLTESIGTHGILSPLLVRPLEETEGKYEIISGHRRYAAAQKLGLKKVPCTVHFIDRDAATVMMVDSNCQRTELLPSEKARAYKMKMDAQNRQGQRTDLTSCPSGTKSGKDEKPAEESIRQIYRYIRLTYLIPELLQFVDDGKITMRPAVEMSYLDEDTQRDIVDCIDESGGEVFPSHAQTRRIRELAEKGEVSYEIVSAIMQETKPNQIEKVKIPSEELRQRIGRSMTDKEYIEFIFKAVDHYKRFLQKQRDQGAR
jgi:ParB family chromosome partitioning protein